MSRNAHKLDDASKKRTEDVTQSTKARSFTDLHLGPVWTRALSNSGYFHPSPVQWESLPSAIIGMDLIVQAKSGTGKTLVFALTALKSIKPELDSVQAILIAPTREIAVQGARTVLDISKGAEMNDLKVHTFIGGMSISDDFVKAKKCHIAVGTPGRIRALLDGKHLNPDSVRLFVLDEADKLMEESFKADLTWIFNKLPGNKQVLAMSATYPEELEKLVLKFMKNPEHIKKNIKSELYSVQAILIAPTREIAVQGARTVLDIAKGAEMNDLKVHTFIGGMSISDDFVKAKKCHIAVGTPGRIRALLDGKYLNPDSVRLFVLDEADKLMEESFKADLTWIFNKLPGNKQVLAMSATYPEDLEKLVLKFMKSPEQ